MREVAVIGVGVTKFGELWDKSYRDLAIEAGLLAMKDAKINSEEIDAMYLGNMSAGRLIEQEHVGALAADYAGLVTRNVPSTRIEAADASGGLAFRQGYLAVASGAHDIVVVGGAEKMTDANDMQVVEALASSSDVEWEAFFGGTLPALFAMMARRHMHEYGTTRAQLAAIAVKNHKHATMNPSAQFKNELKLDAVLKAPMVADPLGMFDCSPLSDGAAAVILCPLDKAKKYTDKPVKVIGSGQASDMFSLHDRKSLTTIASTVAASKRAFEQAHKKPSDIHVAELHDSYSIAELISIEDIGFAKPGEAGKALEKGEFSLGGRLPINTSGGLKARGHPLGATGVAQVVEIAHQLRGTAGERQVKGAKVGLTQNIGGTGGTAVVHIFEVA